MSGIAGSRVGEAPSISLLKRAATSAAPAPSLSNKPPLTAPLPAVQRDRETAAALAQAYPQLTADSLAEADRALAGMLVLPGTGPRPHFVGDPPDWFASPASAADNEFVWHLNRLEHWKSLLRGWLLSDDERYREKVIRELRDWLGICRRPPLDLRRIDELFNESGQVKRLKFAARHLERFPAAFRAAQWLRAVCQRRIGSLRRREDHPTLATATAAAAAAAIRRSEVAPWRTLEAGVRMFDVWPLLFVPLRTSPQADSSLVHEFVASAREHAEVLAEISPRIWPAADHNHYLVECLGLLSAACHFPHFAESQRWREQAMREIERCAEAQLTTDGGHVEGCPHYHNCCVYFFCRAALLAREHGLRFSPHLELSLRKSLNHCVHALRPTGRGVPWGDSDPDTLAVKATLFGLLCFDEIGPLRRVARLTGIDAVAHRCFEHLWQVPNAPELLRDLNRSIVSLASTSPSDRRDRLAPTSDTFPLVSHQRQLQQVTMRTGWDAAVLSVFFGCRSPVYNGHAHCDPASFDFTALGQPILVDPGRLTYVDCDDRRRVKSAAYHNCLTIDGREPFEYLSSWRFGPQRRGEIVAMHDHGPSLMAAESMHECFAPAVHRRLIALIDGRYLLVLDRLDHIRPRSSVQIYFHVNSAEAKWDDAARIASATIGDVSAQIRLSDGLSARLLEGKVSDAFDQSRPSLRLMASDDPRVKNRRSHHTRRRCYAALVIPHRRAAAPPVTLSPTVAFDGDAVIALLTVDGVSHRLTWTPGTLEQA